MKLIVLLSIIISLVNCQTAPPGVNGEKGEKGEPGLPGGTGLPGPQGITGEKGAQGQNGDTGLKGDPGFPGFHGKNGLQGPPGPAGATGARGAEGATGADGPQGLPGMKGDVGVLGDLGLRGAKGLRGEPGQPGTLGDKGPKGDPGLPGWPGLKGSTGEQGVEGVRGDPGRTLFEIDEDECGDINSCDTQTTNCVNEALGYTCDCKPGYQHENNVSCTDINECSVNNGGCSHTCTNIIGSFTCSCPSGTQLSLDMLSCLDHDECFRPIDNICTGTDVCVNVFQSHDCVDPNEAPIDTGSAAGQTDQLSYLLLTNAAIWVLIIWLALITVVVIIVLIWLVIILRRKYSKNKSTHHYADNMAYNTDALSDSQSVGGPGLSEQMTDQRTMEIDIPKLPPSQKNTMKKSGRKSYNSKKDGSSVGRTSRPPSATSFEGDRTASVRSTRAAAGERLSNVDTHY